MLAAQTPQEAQSAQPAHPPAAADKPDPRRLPADELKKMLEGKEKLFLLDVREPKELEQDGAIEGAVNIPLGTLDKRLADVPKDVKLISICRRARRAARAADLLEKDGHSGIRTFAMEDWKAKGYSLTHPKAPEKVEQKDEKKDEKK